MGSVLAVECVLDERERQVDLKVALLQNGKPPHDYAFTSDGQRVRDHVTEVLIRRGVRGFGFKRVTDSGDLQSLWRQILANYAHLLKTSGEAILSEDPSTFSN